MLFAGKPPSTDGLAPPKLEAASLAARLNAGLLDAATALVMICDDGEVEFANRRLEAMLGLGNLTGTNLGKRLPDLGVPSRGTREDIAVSALLDSSGGRWEIVWTRNSGGGWIGVAANAARGRTADQPDQRHVDLLTGLGNRAHLDLVFGDLVKSQEANAWDTIALYLDLDHFKRAGEMLDHDEIEDLLRKVARRLRQATRAQDIVARVGDDAFAVIVSSSDARPVAIKLALRITELLSRPFLVGGHQILTGATVGLAGLSQGAKSMEELLRLASIALRHARKQGQGHGEIQWFDESMEAAILERHAILVGLRKALLLDEFELHYQPQFSFAGTRISGFEALIRWRHPERGMMSPAVFIPIAEEMGLITQIGEWVLRQACIAASGWDEDVTVAVNVSPVQFEEKGFVEMVADALRRSGLVPRRLEIEVTEALLLANSEETVRKMNALLAFGVRIALDDFGVGYSSLNYLRQFPFTKIKIDQSFVRGPSADEAATRIVAAVADLSQTFGMTVIAEGVETEKQLETMRGCGCDAVQGYLFSKPIPEAKVIDYIATAAGTKRADYQEDEVRK